MPVRGWQRPVASSWTLNPEVFSIPSWTRKPKPRRCFSSPQSSQPKEWTIPHHWFGAPKDSHWLVNASDIYAIVQQCYIHSDIVQGLTFRDFWVWGFAIAYSMFYCSLVFRFSIQYSSASSFLCLWFGNHTSLVKRVKPPYWVILVALNLIVRPCKTFMNPVLNQPSTP